MTRLTRSALVAAWLLTAPAWAQDKPNEFAPKSTGRIEKKTYDFKEAGKEMEYRLFVPSNYDKAKKWPLIVALHGLYSNPQQILNYPKFTELAQKHGYILAAPMGYNDRGWYGNGPPWQANPDPKNLYELSEKDVMNVLEIVRKDYNVDPDRIYLLGHSMGGGGALYLGAKHPDLWAALAPIAPALFRPTSDLEKIKHVPVILVQAEKDVLVRVERVRPWAEKMKELKLTYQYIEQPGGDHFTIGFKYLPEVFAFFNEHKKTKK